MNWWKLAWIAYFGIGLGIAVHDWKYFAPREPTFARWPRPKVLLYAALFLVLTVIGWPLDLVDWARGRWRRSHPKPVRGRREPGS